LKNRSWERPKDWKILDNKNREKWNEIADHLEQFYRDMRTHRHINTGLSSYMTPNEKLSYHNFCKTLEDQNKIYDAANMLSKIAASEGGTRKLVEITQGRLNEKDLPYIYLSQFAFVLILTFESNLNILKKTLTTDNLTTKKGKPWLKSIEETSPEVFFELLVKYSEGPVQYIQNMIFQYKSLRNAFSHGLFWYENEGICWLDNANSSDTHSIQFGEFLQILREQSMFSQCYLWVTGKLIRERFFEP